MHAASDLEAQLATAMNKVALQGGTDSYHAATPIS